MREHSLEIINRLGLHARAAAKFSTTASQFSCQIRVQYQGKIVNGKSIMGLMMLAAARGTQILVTVDGSDEIEALQALSLLINNRFGEAE
ncbi:MAG TPA: HPr family phosphocarrier protein [Halothiobacillus sp.]|nr:MAG: phosphocarrier protein HPr [Halothiobacillus sp. 20-54-6]HQT44315.1 HPr family phosphocarrier protein [Halothiobacillus sp.]